MSTKKKINSRRRKPRDMGKDVIAQTMEKARSEPPPPPAVAVSSSGRKLWGWRQGGPDSTRLEALENMHRRLSSWTKR